MAKTMTLDALITALQRLQAREALAPRVEILLQDRRGQQLVGGVLARLEVQRPSGDEPPVLLLHGRIIDFD